MARTAVQNGTSASGLSSRLQRQPCQKYTRMSVTTASDTHPHCMMRSSPPIWDRLAPRSAHTRNPTDMRFVAIRKSFERKDRLLISPVSVLIPRTMILAGVCGVALQRLWPRHVVLFTAGGLKDE